MEPNKLSYKEKKFIKKELINRLKLIRYLAHAMIIICLLFVGVPIFIDTLKEGDIIKALISFSGVIYPIAFFYGVYLLMELISGNQIFKFMMGNYIVQRETIVAKYRETKLVNSSTMPIEMHVHRRTYEYFCDTIGHSRVPVESEISYRNADNGKEAIVLQFGKNKNNVTLFVPPEDNE